ncbi:pentapeptide repeat-containing protein [Fulvivirga sp. M361]|uniref:pentapeptide repeat-containing protein n=1 Tax=Fulvivirga sp. M361 TaxID=2594266 RepID=UPI00117B3A9F|nr:pentapeptide repeat-containing protein [Fulvivirga sp. M361]TRX56203.1 pentapeptide repeat-containing protein [Fulvivirga sp. M361]
MNNPYIEGEEFKGLDFTREPLPKGEYEDCIFTKCTLSNADLFGVNFVDCEFIQCNISTANISNTGFRQVLFKECKLLGLRFEHCSDFLFSVNFEDCQLDLSSFYKRSMKNAYFKNCSLKEVDFSEANLTNARFLNCDLTGTSFDRTQLGKADFRTSYNFTLDPETNVIKGARFSREGIIGLLSKYNIHIE